MNVPHPLYEVLYASTLNRPVPFSEVAIISRHARQANEVRQATGLLVLDGRRFGQQIESHKKTVLALIEKSALTSDTSRLKCYVTETSISGIFTRLARATAPSKTPMHWPRSSNRIAGSRLKAL